MDTIELAWKQSLADLEKKLLIVKIRYGAWRNEFLQSCFRQIHGTLLFIK